VATISIVQHKLRQRQVVFTKTASADLPKPFSNDRGETPIKSNTMLANECEPENQAILADKMRSA